MAVTINNVRLDVSVNPPTIEFLQGADMNVTSIRNTLRALEADPSIVDIEGSPDAGGLIVKSSGNEAFDATTSNALTVVVLPPFVVKFEAGAIAYKSAQGNFLATFVDSPGAIVQINNAVGATNLNSADIEYASFGNGVTIDTLNGVAGMTFPTGTPRQPSNNLVDAHMILEERGFEEFHLRGNLTINSGAHPHIFVGQGMAHSTITVGGTADVHDAEFRDCMVMGALNGAVEFERGHIMNVTGFLGSARNTMLQGTITLGGNPGLGPHGTNAHFLDCYSAVIGSGTPIIDLNGTGYGLALRGYNGGITIRNKTGPESVSIDMNSGQVIIDNTVTGGTIVLRGVGHWANKQTYIGGATIVDNLVDGIEVHELHSNAGLELGNPVTITPTGRVTQNAAVNVAIGGDGATVSTLTRQ